MAVGLVLGVELGQTDRIRVNSVLVRRNSIAFWFKTKRNKLNISCLCHCGSINRIAFAGVIEACVPK